jgi:hypothetical protein
VITDKDNGYKAVLELLLKPAPGLQVGILGADAEAPHGDSGKTVGDIALYQELGTPTIPQRPFISGWWDKHASEAVSKLQSLINLKQGAKNIGWIPALRQLGEWSVAGIKEEMTDIPPPLAESTVRKKGRSETLVDTEQMRNAISYKVNPNARRR